MTSLLMLFLILTSFILIKEILDLVRSYTRVTRSVLLIKTKTPPIASTIIAPATKLAIKFPNEAVIFFISRYLK